SGADRARLRRLLRRRAGAGRAEDPLPPGGAHGHDPGGDRRGAATARHPRRRGLAAGLTALVCGQAAVNLAAVLGLAPLTGIPLPFVSYGGSSLVVELVAVGILLNIAASGGRAAAEVPDRGRGDGRSRPARD